MKTCWWQALRVAAASMGLAGSASAQVSVSIPSADLSRGPGLMLKGFWFVASASPSTPAPAVEKTAWCSGIDDDGARRKPRINRMAAGAPVPG